MNPVNSMPDRKHQRGAATLLVVVMLGLAVSVTVAATAYSLRGTQARQMTTHAVTAAQAAAWRGVETLRRYLLEVDEAVWPAWVGADEKAIAGLEAIGVRAARVTQVTDVGGGRYQVTALVTGQAGAGTSLTTATVEAVYDVLPTSGTPGTPGVCHSLPKAPMVFNGDLDYTGGKLDVDDGRNDWDYKNIVVAGNMTIGGGSMAKVSGCVKGNVTLSGGGITDNGHIFSEKKITVNGMGNPANTAFWAEEIQIGSGVSGGHYASLRAGAYAATVEDGAGRAIGSARIGGTLLDGTVDEPLTLPWTRGIVVPPALGEVVIKLDDGNDFLLDLGRTSFNPLSGKLSGAAGAEWLGGNAPQSALPDVLRFAATDVPRGSIALATLSIDELWGHALTVSGWSGKYTRVRANGHASIADGTIGDFQGGGNFTASMCGGGNGSYWSLPTVTGGKLAGDAYCKTAPIPPASLPATTMKFASRIAKTNPGLPGVPFCDARVVSIEADAFRASANYIFESAGGAPRLTIQNVKKGTTGASIDGVYMLNALDTDEKALLADLMTCKYGNDQGCLTVRKGDGTWNLEGVRRFPPGVAWFDNALTVAGTDVDLNNTLVNKRGDISLTSAGHKDLIAPNFAGSLTVCGAAYYPSNLCTNRTDFVRWKDAEDKEHVGLPIGNMAILAEGGLAAQGWTIQGNVNLGGKLLTSGAVVNITGSLTVGSNGTASTTVSAGGVHLAVPRDGDRNDLPICSGATPPAFVAGSSTVTWSRYR